MSLKKINEYYYKGKKIEIFKKNPYILSVNELSLKEYFKGIELIKNLIYQYYIIVKVNGKIVSDIPQCELIRVEPVLVSQ